MANFDNNPALIPLVAVGATGVGLSARAYRLLRSGPATAVDDDLIRRNPCRLRKAGAEAAALRPTLTAGQVAALAGRVPARYSALILLTTYASLRWGEDAASIRVRHSYSELSTGQITLGPA